MTRITILLKFIKAIALALLIFLMYELFILKFYLTHKLAENPLTKALGITIKRFISGISLYIALFNTYISVRINKLIFYNPFILVSLYVGIPMTLCLGILYIQFPIITGGSCLESFPSGLSSSIGSTQSDHMDWVKLSFLLTNTSLPLIPRLIAPTQLLLSEPDLSVRIERVTTGKAYGENLLFHLKNVNLLSGEDVLRAIYNTLINDPQFRDYSYFKTMIVVGIYQDSKHSFHNSVLINNDTSFEEFYDGICSGLADKYVAGYSMNVYPEFSIRVWNADSLRNKNVKISISAVTGLPQIEVKNLGELQTRLNKRGVAPKPGPNNPFADSLGHRINYHSSSPLQVASKKAWRAPNFNIKPLIRGDKTVKPIATMDLETIEFNGSQYPVAISMAHLKSDYKIKVKSPKVISKLFLIELPVASSDLITEYMLRTAVQQMFNQYFQYCLDNKIHHFLVHNLGSFDGLFLFKALFGYFHPAKIQPLMDADHRFIHIQAEFTEGTKIEWRDSYRIFPVSLNDLCTNFGVEGKAGKYLPEFNNLDMLLEGSKRMGLPGGNPTAQRSLFIKFKDYSLADSESLLRALLVAQSHYFNEFQVDIMGVYSTASLAMKVFRHKFFPGHVNEIPILKNNVDIFVRKAYLGGATDVFKRYAEAAHYYDVNSLYPAAQCKPMPFSCIGYKKQLKSLEGFFGFVEVKVTAPLLPKPMLPFKGVHKTIFPTGTWTGVYFSEELKAVAKLGYQFKLGQAYEFSSEVLFKDYIDHFYEIKRSSAGPQRFIAKMMLNNLYGTFGRALQGIKPLIINSQDAMGFLTLLSSKSSLTHINNYYAMILTTGSSNNNNLEKLNTRLFEDNVSTFSIPPRANVAIAAAVTSYARIHMMDLKLNYDVLYSDTDSIFTTHPLPDHLIGSDIGQLKDELGGAIIDRAYFLGIKQYGYTYKDQDGNKVDKSVWAGISRDTIPFDTIESIASGATHHVVSEKRFFRDLANLDIAIKPIDIKVVDNKDKPLINNVYYPISLTGE